MFEMILNSPMVSFMVIFVITVFSALIITFLYIIPTYVTHYGLSKRENAWGKNEG